MVIEALSTDEQDAMSSVRGDSKIGYKNIDYRTVTARDGSVVEIPKSTKIMCEEDIDDEIAALQALKTEITNLKVIEK